MVAHISNAPFFSRQETGIDLRRIYDERNVTEVVRTLTKVCRKVISNMADGLHNGETTSSSNSTVSEEFVPAECKFTVHTFSDTLLDQNIHFQILKMTDSLYMWIGSSLQMNTLAVAMCTKFDSVPSVVNLMGNKADLGSSTLAQRLAKKTNKQCFVSYNIPTENMLLGLVEQRINKEIKDKPQQF